MDGGLKRHSFYLHDGVRNLINEAKDKPVVLVLNKSDLIKSQDWIVNKIYRLTGGIINGDKVIRKRRTFFTKLLKSVQQEDNDAFNNDSMVFQKFKRVFVTSALNNEGVKDLTVFYFRISFNVMQ